MPFKNKEDQSAASRKGGLAIVAQRGKEYMKQIAKNGAQASIIAKKRKKLFGEPKP